jgi:methylthioribulose-1-phosphate dehydratase
MTAQASPQRIIVELCRQMYQLGWATGTGGGISIRENGRVYMAPSGVQKERLAEDEIYVLDEAGQVQSGPTRPGLKPSECAPLFYNAFRLRDAGAVLHSHGMFALLASLGSAPALRGGATVNAGDTFECTELEMIKGISGHGYYDRLVVPIVENTAHECDLADRMAAAIEAYPQSSAVLVRRHGVYIWGRDAWHAKAQAECYHYLFEASVRMAGLGVDARVGTRVGTDRPPAAMATPKTAGGKR